MKIPGYVIIEPGADRPYFCHEFPERYERKPGSRVFFFELEVPEPVREVDGTAQLV